MSLLVLQQMHQNSRYYSALAKGIKKEDANSKTNNITKYMKIKTGGKYTIHTLCCCSLSSFMLQAKIYSAIFHSMPNISSKYTNKFPKY